MRIIHTGGFRQDEKIQMKGVIYSNVLAAFKSLLDIMRDEDIEFDNELTETHADVLRNARALVGADYAFRDMKVQQAMLAMWDDGAVQNIIADSHEYILNETLTFYFQGNIPMFDPSWMPNDQDMLHARMKTTGITETIFELGALTLRMVDVGGQRSEQKKWIHCFDGVNCLLFVASLSGYDQCLVEDVNANQMCEALALFNSVIQSEWFKDKPVILFLNKVDLFRNKLAMSHCQRTFPTMWVETMTKRTPKPTSLINLRHATTRGKYISISQTQPTLVC
jgi:guanine nucleotide-binding protein subunit alpha